MCTECMTVEIAKLAGNKSDGRPYYTLRAGTGIWSRGVLIVGVNEEVARVLYVADDKRCRPEQATACVLEPLPAPLGGDDFNEFCAMFAEQHGIASSEDRFVDLTLEAIEARVMTLLPATVAGLQEAMRRQEAEEREAELEQPS